MMIQIFVFVPERQKEVVKAAMFEAGGGKIGNYKHCCFEHKGLGQFMPLAGSSPFIGQQDQLEHVDEIKIEMTCEDHLFGKIIEAMKKVHPYEAPAYYGIKTLSL